MLQNTTNLDTIPTNTHKTNRKNLYLLTLNLKNTNKDTSRLALIIIQITLFEIWQTRNNNKYDKNLLPQHSIISKLNVQLQRIVQARYKKHKLNDTVNQFIIQ